MLGSPVAEERKRRWRVETWRSEQREDVTSCWGDWSRAEMVKGCKGALRGEEDVKEKTCSIKNIFRPYPPAPPSKNLWDYWVMWWGHEESYLAHENVLGAGWWWVCLTAPLGHNKVNSCHFQSLQAATANHSKGYLSMSEGLNANFIQSDGNQTAWAFTRLAFKNFSTSVMAKICVHGQSQCVKVWWNDSLGVTAAYRMGKLFWWFVNPPTPLMAYFSKFQ